ncbi:MAG: lipopolysaccharide heptosyltransferase I [Thermodesulfobacteriota bacterium]|nr:MAG: lipopolysaccharide heptosyltransferase I [Thermodesulfobacteriota bacterium]
MSNSEGMKILIIKLSSLGDVIQTLPVLIPLKKKFPDAKISWLVEEEAAELIKGHPLVDQIIISRKNRWIRALSNPVKLPQIVQEGNVFCKDLRSCSYDFVIDFQGLLKSGIFVGVSRGKRKLGFAPVRERAHIFLNEKISFPKTPLHAVERYLFLIASLGCSRLNPEFFIPIRQNHRDRVLKFLQENDITLDKPLILLHPGTRWKTKMWIEEKWAVLGDWLQEKTGAQVAFTGSANDFYLIERITGQMKFAATNTAGRWSLNELAFLQKQADVVITPDSGPMHLASAMGTPVVALFGPTDPKLTGPYGEGHRVIMKTTDCQPCFKRTCSANDCMKEITVKEVWEATEEMLASINKTERGAKLWL